MAINDYRNRSAYSYPVTSIGDRSGVSIPNIDYTEMSREWELIDDLLGGTGMMRSRGEKWLPRETNEHIKSYSNKLLRAFLFNGLGDAIEKLVQKPFSKPVTVEELENEQLKLMVDDVDGLGTNLTQLCKLLFTDLVTYGKCHLWIDYPNTGGRINLADQRKNRIHPLMQRIKPHDLIGWQSVKELGKERIVQVRIKEEVKVPDGQYGEKVEHIVWVYIQEKAGQRVSWEKHVREEDGSYTLVDQGEMSITRIPILTGYANREALHTSIPPLRDLAEINLAHWQSSAEHRSYLGFARIGMLGMTGLSPDEVDKPQTVAPSATLRSINPDAKFYYVEHTGRALEAGERDLQHLEKQMEVLGMQPFIERTQDSTATGKAIDNDESKSDIQSWIGVLENLVESGFSLSAEFINYTLPEGFWVNVYSDFSIAVRDTKDLDFLLNARIQGELTRRTFLVEIKRRAVLAENTNVDDEVTELDKEEEQAFNENDGTLPNPFEENDEPVIDEDEEDDVE